MDNDSCDFETEIDDETRTLEDELEKTHTIKRAYQEIRTAIEAQMGGKPAPKMTTIPLILLEGEFDTLPKDIWHSLACLLYGKFIPEKKKRGRPRKDLDDICTAEEFDAWRASGKKSRDIINELGKVRGYSGDPSDIARSVLRAIKRGRKLGHKENSVDSGDG